MNLITQSKLQEILHYDPSSGQMQWKKPLGKVRPGTPITCKDQRGYVVVRLLGKLYRAHRLAWLWVHGVMPNIIDHINRDKSDNRISNLRDCTARENLLNASINSRNTSGFKGVSFDKRKKLYRSYTSKNGKQVFLGYFKTAEDAHQRYVAEYEGVK